MRSRAQARLPDHPVTVGPPSREAGLAHQHQVERPTGRTTWCWWARSAWLVRVDGDRVIRLPPQPPMARSSLPPDHPGARSPRRRRHDLVVATRPKGDHDYLDAVTVVTLFVELRQQLEAAYILEDRIVRYKGNPEPDRRRGHPAIGFVILLPQPMSRSDGPSAQRGVSIREARPRPDDIGPAKFVLQSLQPARTPSGQSGAEL